MKVLLTNYTFDASARQVTFTDYTSIDLERILLITNVTDGIIIYNFSNHSLGGSVLNNVLTLTYNSSVMDDTDKLQIFYDDNINASISISNIDMVENSTKIITKTIGLISYIKTISFNALGDVIAVSTWEPNIVINDVISTSVANLIIPAIGV